VPDIDMEDANYVCIPVRMSIVLIFIFMCHNHHIRVHSRINGVLTMVHIVASIIDTEYLMAVNSVVDKSDMIAVIVSERVFVFIIGNVHQMSQ